MGTYACAQVGYDVGLDVGLSVGLNVGTVVGLTDGRVGEDVAAADQIRTRTKVRIVLLGNGNVSISSILMW